MPNMARASVVPRLATLTVAVVLASACASVPPAFHAEARDARLARRIAKLVRPTGARFGISALHIESGRRLSWNGGEPFEAASVIKLALLTEAAARATEGKLDLK